MHTIFLNTENEAYNNYRIFNHKLIEICNEHKKEGKALAFAFILYDFENAQLWKILNDKEYWMSLHTISGKYLTVFSLNYKEDRNEKGNLFYHMFSVLTKMNPSEGTNKLIQKYFGKIKVTYPSILFFQVDNSKVIDSLLISLKEDEIEKSFNELKKYFKNAVEALKQITEENKKNYKEIFDCLESDVKRLKNKNTIKRISKNAGSIISLGSAIKGLLSLI